MIHTNQVLTLPGIAGLLLTMGMAVDANILIYERIREELALGKSVSLSVYDGFDRAFVTIFDSNLILVLYLDTAAAAYSSLSSSDINGFNPSRCSTLIRTPYLFEIPIHRRELSRFNNSSLNV